MALPALVAFRIRVAAKSGGSEAPSSWVMLTDRSPLIVVDVPPVLVPVIVLTPEVWPNAMIWVASAAPAESASTRSSGGG